MRSFRGVFVLGAALLTSLPAQAQRPAGKAAPVKPVPAKDEATKDAADKKPDKAEPPDESASLPPAPPAPAGAAKKPEAGTPPSEPAAAGEGSVDTRSSAMRAYYQALEKRKMAAASPLS